MAVDPYRDWLHLADNARPPNHYQLLGVATFEPDMQRIEAAYAASIASVRRYQVGAYGELAQRIIGELSAAYTCLTHAERKRAYDRTLSGAATALPRGAAVPDRPQATAVENKLPAQLPQPPPPAARLPPASPPAPLSGHLNRPVLLMLADKAAASQPAVHPTGQRHVRRKPLSPLVVASVVVPVVAIIFLFIGIVAWLASSPRQVPLVVVAAPSPSAEARAVPATAAQPPSEPAGQPPVANAVNPEPASSPGTETEPPVVNWPAVSPTPPPSSTPSGGEGRTVGEEQDHNALKLKLIWCPPGNFTMGSPANEEGHQTDEGPVPVTLAKGFWLGKHEVTQGQWQQVMASTPWKGRSFVKEGPDYPATYVAWDDPTSTDDVIEFCNRLTDSERRAGRLPAAWKYDLPTEAQWEYACRAGKQTRFSFGDDEGALTRYAWYEVNADKVGEDYAHQVGQKLANTWGLHDVHGNVWEWCRDLYQEKLPGGRDPEGISGSHRVYRGGSWYDGSVICRSAYRNGDTPEYRYGNLGFRLARVPSSK